MEGQNRTRVPGQLYSNKSAVDAGSERAGGHGSCHQCWGACSHQGTRGLSQPLSHVEEGGLKGDQVENSHKAWVHTATQDQVSRNMAVGW